MLESFMEDLLWKYPDDFFPRHGFKQAARQFTLSGAGRLDISFRDANDRLWVIEVKAVPIRLEVADQVYRYAQKLREAQPLDSPIPAVVAPVINQTVRDHFDKWGIEHFEIPEASFRRVATERGIAVEAEPSPSTMRTSVKRPKAKPPGTDARSRLLEEISDAWKQRYPLQSRPAAINPNSRRVTLELRDIWLKWAMNRETLRAEIQIYSDDRALNERIFDALMAQRAALEARVGHRLEWNRNEGGKRGCFVLMPYEHAVTLTEPDAFRAQVLTWALEDVSRLGDAVTPLIRRFL